MLLCCTRMHTIVGSRDGLEKHMHMYTSFLHRKCLLKREQWRWGSELSDQMHPLSHASPLLLAVSSTILQMMVVSD